MEVTGWMMHMAKLAIIIFTITTTATTTLYVQLDNLNSYRPLNDAYEPTATDLLMKRDYGDIPGVLRFGKRNYEIDPVYKKAAPNLLQLGDNVYDKKDVPVSALSPGVLRFGKREGDIPGVLRFGKRDDNDIPGVLRFGKRSAPSLLRFGRR
uniref:Uncharacterized protein n=1 Tax=Setaria digitata TaxID=48799 RepID=A0A915Q3U5_9BILA